jgi:hypothetical protein
MFKKALLLTLTSLSAMAMHTAELNINNKDVEATIKFDMGQFNTALQPASYYLGAGVLSGGKEHSNADDTDILAEVNFLVQSPLHSINGLTFGLGLKFNRTEVASETFMSLPLGVEASYRFYPLDTLPLKIGAAFYYAPSPLAFENAEKYQEERVYLDIELIQYGALTIGYRNIDTDFEQGDMNYNDSVYAGFKFMF